MTNQFTSTNGDPLQRAKERLSIFDLWRILDLPSNPGKSCYSPFRNDGKRPGFSVWKQGHAWHDFGTGEGGDQIDFLAKATGLNRPDSCRELIRLSGITQNSKNEQKSSPQSIDKTESSCGENKRLLQLPVIRKGNLKELKSLSRLRNVSVESLNIASDRNILWFSDIVDGNINVTIWIITDLERRNAQARRLDGRLWQSLDGQPKAKTLLGSEGGWLIGAAEIRNLSFIALVEGGPDLLAAFHLAHAEGKINSIAPVCITGGNIRIHQDALCLFKGKNIRIFPHMDCSGQLAARRWANQLWNAGAILVTGFSFKRLYKVGGDPILDLNDLCYQDVDNWEEFWSSRELFSDI